MRTFSITLRILQQLRHDPRTVIMMIFVPMLVLTLLSFIFNGSDYNPKIGAVHVPSNFIYKLENQDAKVFRYSEYEAHEALRASEVDAVITLKRGIPQIELEGSDPNKNQAVLAVIQKASQGPTPTVHPDVTYVYGYEEMSSFDNFGSILIGMFVFLFVFLISSVAFLGERTSGTLERLLTTPVYRWEIVLGYLLGFGFFTVIQSALVAWFAINILDVMMIGSYGLVLLVTILTAMAALSMGISLSTLANNELQVIQLIQVTLVPQVFFSGLFDITAMPVWLQALSRIMPLSYAVDALKTIMIRGKGFSDIAGDVGVLLGLCLVLFVVNTFALKKYRKI
ncbi:ABC transporter permease [Paenibacillus sp. TY11]|uniref:ABC transporter permease n=1 Tax=Paenibacillus sp. TY11 TaxID=3448633 RepID=UPI0040397A41